MHLARNQTENETNVAHSDDSRLDSRRREIAVPNRRNRHNAKIGEVEEGLEHVRMPRIGLEEEHTARKRTYNGDQVEQERQNLDLDLFSSREQNLFVVFWMDILLRAQKSMTFSSSSRAKNFLKKDLEKLLQPIEPHEAHPPKL